MYPNNNDSQTAASDGPFQPGSVIPYDGDRPGNDAVPVNTPPSELDSIIGRMLAESEQLEKVAMVLRERLAPVLQDKEDPAEGNGSGKTIAETANKLASYPYSAPAARQLADIQSRNATTRRLIERLLTRLAV